MGKYEMTATIKYDYLKPDSTLTLPGFMKYVQQVSLEQTDSTEFPMKWLHDHDFGWGITHWDVIFHKYPFHNDTITLETWPCAFKGLFAERSFKVSNSNGETMLTANSNWFFTDLVKRKACKPSKEICDSYGEVFPLAHDKNFETPNIDNEISEGNLKLVSTNTLTVTRRDIDTNNHVNNISYFTWIFDIIQEELYQKSNVSHMKTVYRKECLLGDEISILFYVNTVDSKKTVARITKKNGDSNSDQDVVLTEIFLDWTE